MTPMNVKLSAQILITFSIGYGTTVALLAVVAPSAVTTVAIIGALVIGGLWAVRGVFLNGRTR
jgi:hypothetical protein